MPRTSQYTLKQLESDDQAVVNMMRATTTMEQGIKAVETMDRELARLEETKQWDADRFLRA